MDTGIKQLVVQARTEAAPGEDATEESVSNQERFKTDQEMVDELITGYQGNTRMN